VATATAPKTRVSNPAIAPKAPLAVAVDEGVEVARPVDEAKVEVTTVVRPPVLAPTVPIAVGTRVEELAVAKGNEAVREDPETETSKLGGGTAWAGLTSEPVPQGIEAPDPG